MSRRDACSSTYTLVLLWVIHLCTAFHHHHHQQQQQQRWYFLPRHHNNREGGGSSQTVIIRDISNPSFSLVPFSLLPSHQVLFHSSSSSSILWQQDGDDNQLYRTKLEEEVESSKGMSNTKYLQGRFNLTDSWAEKAASQAPAMGSLRTLHRSTLIQRIDWLKEQLDLTEEQCGKILQKFPYTLAYRSDTNLGPTFQFLKKKLAINTMELSKIVQQQPSILGKGIEEDQTLQRNINWMEKRLGLKKPREKGEVLLRGPGLFTFSVEGNLDPSFQMLQDRLEITEKQTAKMCRNFPEILGCNFTRNIEPKLDMLQNRLDLNATQLGKLCLKAPTILGLNYTTNLEPKLTVLQEKMNLNSTELGRFCLKAPKILCYNYTTNMEPTINWLQHRLCLNKNELRKVIKKQPTLIGFNPDKTFVPRLTWLHDRLGLDDDSVKKMILGQPQILYLTIEEKMEPTLQWLEKTLSLDDVGIQTIMIKQPSLFNYNITTNLGRTLDFYKMCIGEEEALDMVTEKPIYFTYSLKRMQERYDQVCEMGVEVDNKCLRRIAGYRKSDWDAFIRRCKTKGIGASLQGQNWLLTPSA